MCGIIGYTGSEDPQDILLDGLRRLEYRGYDSAGIAVVEPEGIQILRSKGPIAALEAKLDSRRYRGSIGFGHTRWATHGVPNETNAHPHRAGSVVLVHNGIIENYLDHKASLVRKGVQAISETDSEIVAHLIDWEIQSGATLQEAIKVVLPQLRGSYAFVVWSDKQPDILIGVRNGVQLLVGMGAGGNFLASDIQAIEHRTNKILYLKDGEMAECRRNEVLVTTHEGEPVPLEIKVLKETPKPNSKGEFQHFMLKEIYEQPHAIERTILGNLPNEQAGIKLDGLSRFRDSLKNIKRVTLVACGTARHAALVGKYYLGRYCQLPVDVDFGSEFRYRAPQLEPGTLLILISQSGETADTLAALREGKAKGVPTLAICNVRESSLTREADLILYTNAGPEIGVASTKAFTTQLTALYMLALEIGQIRGTLSEKKVAELTADLMQLPKLVEQTVTSLSPVMEQEVAKFKSKKLFLFLGRGVNYPIALEGALKLKEITYLHAEGYAAGELKHGPIALIDSATCVFALAAKPHALHSFEEEGTYNVVLHEKLMSNLEEARSRGAQIYTVSTQDEPIFNNCENLGTLPRTNWGLTPILQTIPLQLFSYWMAVQRGTDVDKPRNLAKSVTVE